ncbi:hypothetical protein [Streptomyces sp. NPDC057740]|uniref:hypothetical protein n=1 Tax=Streptomyces sp. NPDC057740 TaxID=3346234 RepID=UPI003691C949
MSLGTCSPARKRRRFRAARCPSTARRSPAVDGHILRVDDELAELHLLRGAPIGELLGRRVPGVFADLPRSPRRWASIRKRRASGCAAWRPCSATGSRPLFRFEALLALRARAPGVDAG